MTASAVATLAPTCPACGSRDTSRYPPSRTTGRSVGGCSSCGCHWLINPRATSEVVAAHDFDRTVYESYVAGKRDSRLAHDYLSTLRRLDALIESGGRALFDVGAGAGEFLDLARSEGFEPHGNELPLSAVELARERTGIELHVGDLATLEGENMYDAATMWCVLAHVTEPDELLRNVLRILKPGGILFLQTPRWSAMDTIALGAARASRGRLVRVLDRRVNDYHMVLNSQAGLAAQSRRIGFEVVDVAARARYSIQTHHYLNQLGMPPRASKQVAKALDIAVDRDLFFRNVLDLYARKPMA